MLSAPLRPPSNLHGFPQGRPDMYAMCPYHPKAANTLQQGRRSPRHLVHQLWCLLTSAKLTPERYDRTSQPHKRTRWRLRTRASHPTTYRPERLGVLSKPCQRTSGKDTALRHELDGRSRDAQQRDRASERITKLCRVRKEVLQPMAQRCFSIFDMSAHLR